MDIEYSGYREGYGFFSFKIPVDETKSDYEIHLKDGSILRQTGPFETRTADWNCDGDISTQFGAFFQGPVGGADFLTPVNMIEIVVHEKGSIPGINHPFHRPSLEQRMGEARNHKSFHTERTPHEPER